MTRWRIAIYVSLATTLAVFLLCWLPGPTHGLLAAARQKGCGNIVFEVPKNKLELPHVFFSHDEHLDAGQTCKDCHNGKVFRQERQLGINSFSMRDISRGKACGSCHDGKTKVKGKVVFQPRNNCRRCHKMKWRKRSKRKR